MPKRIWGTLDPFVEGGDILGRKVANASFLAALLKVAAETLEHLKRSLPADVSDLIPHTVEDLRQEITVMLREHAHRISAA